MSHRSISVLVVLNTFVALWQGQLAAHDHSRPKAEQQQRDAQLKAAQLAEAPAAADERKTCRLTIRLRDASQDTPLAGLLRVTNINSGKAVGLPSEIHRELNWYSVPADVTLNVPQTQLRIDAFHGIETELSTVEIDVTGKNEATADVRVRRFYDPRARQLRSGNTHLHLMKMSYLEALEYLQLVPQSDGLDLVFLSHLRRVPDERDYISNSIVEKSFSGGDLQRLSQQGALFGIGEEHRHNFGRGGEGYGHVMLLDIAKLIQPVSIGPGIMGDGTDGLPLQRGIREARGDGATVIWCHNTFGFEDIPNWMAGLLHAQNIFDGGEHGSYEDTYYKYLNIGLHVPFSTGTDWFIYDFSRVYVPVGDKLTTAAWLGALHNGRSYITNGPFLEFTVNDRSVGDTIALSGPAGLKIRGRAVSRNDFRAIELVRNGKVIGTSPSQKEGAHFTATLEMNLEVDQPGWLALRIPRDAGKNELDKPLFAHTSPIYYELAGRRIFQPAVARELIADIEGNMTTIQRQAKFASDKERDAVLQVHRQGIATLRDRLGEK